MTLPKHLAERVRLIREPAAWTLEAACKDHPEPDLWFLVDGPWGGLRPRKEAKAAIRICADCPVQRDCLDEALRTKEPHGIWGGLLPEQRRRLITRTNRRD